MDENENIDEESLNKLLKIADMIDGINKKRTNNSPLVLKNTMIT